jgi:hypothetical protein
MIVTELLQSDRLFGPIAIIWKTYLVAGVSPLILNADFTFMTSTTVHGPGTRLQARHIAPDNLGHKVLAVLVPSMESIIAAWNASISDLSVAIATGG